MTKFIVNAAWNLLAIAKKMYLNLEKEGLAHGKPLLCINHKPFFVTTHHKIKAMLSKHQSFHHGILRTLCAGCTRAGYSKVYMSNDPPSIPWVGLGCPIL
jgi:hypothetical protein